MSGIKSDNWIREQCLPSQGIPLGGSFVPMIEPYEPGQVRTRMRLPTKAEKLAFEAGHQNNKEKSWYDPDYTLPEGAVVTLGAGLLIPEKIIS
jgi:hypothetical protein